jgi:LuxR family transcriptional regulator
MHGKICNCENCRAKRISKKPIASYKTSLIIKDLNTAPSPHTRLLQTDTGTRININNYPYGWNKLYKQNGYAANDPILAHCNQSSLPILWSEDIFCEVPELWQALEHQGLSHGWTQAVHEERGTYYSLFSLARMQRPIDPEEHYGNLGYAIFASQRLHALACQRMSDAEPSSQTVHLSPREIEVLRWSAEGKTASEVGRILCLSERTVNFHVNSCMRKLNVTNKISAVAKAAHIHMI